MFNEAQIASSNGLKLDGDSLFFLLEKDDPTDVDFVIGNCDMINRMEGPNLDKWNLAYVKIALETFILGNCSRPVPLLTQVSDIFEELGGDESYCEGLTADTVKRK